jgi:hypothetical protein
MGKMPNNTWIGRKWELFINWIFEGSILETNRNRLHPWDITWNEGRYNVKSSRLFVKKHGKYFDFKLHDHHSACDYFVLVGYINKRDINPVKIWVIPSVLLLDKTRLCIGRNHRGQWSDFELVDFKRRERKSKRVA